MSEGHILIRKLDEFIRKYYKNKLIRGLLWSVAMLAIYYLVLVVSEFIFHFNQSIRAILFFTFLLSALFLFVRLIFVPILQLIRIGKVISYVQAAGIIGKHFSEIQDKLLNTLQLIEKYEKEEEQSELLYASIEQKTMELKVFSFTRVVDFGKNLRYIRFALPPLLVILLLALLSPKTISDPTSRIIQFNKTFSKPLPFRIEILNRKLSAVQQDDFELNLIAIGSEIPSEVYVKSRDVSLKMTKAKGFHFNYLFKSIQANIPFVIIAGDYISQKYEIEVFPKPTILGFDIKTDFPAYIRRPSEVIENVGDITIPEGTKISWTFYTKDVSVLNFRFGDNREKAMTKKDNTFSCYESSPVPSAYCVSPVNDNCRRTDSLVFRINIVRDGYPTIFITESIDSAQNTSMFFRGTIKDDYGFSKLTFNYSTRQNGDTTKGNAFTEDLAIEKDINNQAFYYQVDLLRLIPGAGANVTYFFEVWDNDQIHGPKSARTEVKELSAPTIEEIIKETEKNEQSMSEVTQQGLNETRSIQKAMDDLNRKFVDQSNISWQERKKIEDIIRANLTVEEKIHEAIRKNKENIENEKKYLETSERITEKQKQLNELMEQLLTDEMKKMVQEMRDLLKKVDKEKLGALIEKMKLSNKDLETQLDRNLALMKQIEFERKLELLTTGLKKTAEKLDFLSDQTLGHQTPKEQLLEKQTEINEKADSLSKKIDDLKKEGLQLETPADLGNTSDKQEGIRKELEEGKKSLEQGKNSDASKSQKKASKQMNDLAKQMVESQQENEDEKLGEDSDNIRMILENLVRLSFEQEILIGNTRIIARNDPRYPEIVVRQREFGEKLNVIEDSLNSISKRQIMMKPFVTKEITSIRSNIDLALEAMDSRNINVAVAKQQYSMTSINNLAVLLNESLEKMKEQMSSSMQSKGGKKACKKPFSKGGKMSAKGMKDLQKDIGQQLQKLKSAMESKAGKEGGDKVQKNAMNRQIAKLAAQQEALRNEMQRYQDEMGSKGLKEQNSTNEAAREMEQIEKDLINKNITQETIMRQQSIMTRLLESEKAEQKREQDEKRESTESKNQKTGNPDQNFQYNIKKKTSFDNIQLTLPVISSFYKSKVNSYIVKIGY